MGPLGCGAFRVNPQGTTPDTWPVEGSQELGGCHGFDFDYESKRSLGTQQGLMGQKNP